MTDYIITILRRESAGEAPYWQSFAYRGDGEATLAVVLDTLNFKDDLFDIHGNPAPRIGWECSCAQGVCGACAMVINHEPALACKKKLKDCGRGEIVLEPLTKFPVIRDLMVDRDVLDQIPIEHGLWPEGDAAYDARRRELQYAASKCMKCGLCVEICPNTSCAANLGAFFAAECFLKRSQSRDRAVIRETQRTYRQHFAAGCSKSMACADVCPAGIDFAKLINWMNR